MAWDELTAGVTPSSLLVCAYGQAELLIRPQNTALEKALGTVLIIS